MNTDAQSSPAPAPAETAAPPDYSKPEPFNPVDEVNKALLFASHPDPFRWQRNMDPNANNKELPVPMRRFLVNRQLRMVLGMAEGVNTDVARYCLVDTGSDADWVMLLNENVAPCMASHDLPAVQS